MKTLGAVKDHPALLMYYAADEFGPDWHAAMRMHQQWIQEADPDHPTWVLITGRDLSPAEMTTYQDTCDAIGSDPYPVPTAMTGKRLSEVTAWTESTRIGTAGTTPMFQVLQAFNQANYLHSPGYRTPTAAEMRSMAWQAIVAGANGLFFYSYFGARQRGISNPRHGRRPF